MGTIWIKELTGGLDTRRLPETSPGGTLAKAINGHINRGGEFEQRAAFVPVYSLPKGTVGLAYTPAGIVVFGSGGKPDGMPASVIYQQLATPDGLDLVKVISYDLFAGKLFVSAQFEDGSLHQFYDGKLVTNYGTNTAVKPGTFVRTYGRKLYYLSDANVIYSNLADPTNFDADSGTSIPDGTTTVGNADGSTVATTRKTNADGSVTVTTVTTKSDGTSTTTTDTIPPEKITSQSQGVGAGFNDLSEEDYGSEGLVAIGRYQNFLAFFSDRTIQIRYMDPDPALSKAQQALHNTGTISPRSVTQFGDADLFYLDTTGLRSLRARDASNSASTSDIGSAIDVLLTEYVREATDAEVLNAIGLIEPRDGRFWLSLGDQIFVFSYFPAAKVSAWSIYEPGFSVDDMAVFDRRVYLRSGDQVYVYGGLGKQQVYDNTAAVAWLPYLDAGTPTETKQLQGIDLACRGTWLVEMGMDPGNLDASDKIATVDATTYMANRIPASHSATHFSVRVSSKAPVDEHTPAVLSSAALTYSADSDKAKS